MLSWLAAVFSENAGFLLFLGLVILVFYLLNIGKHPLFKNVPQGPKGLPLVGYIPYLGKRPHLVLDKLRQSYGNLYGLRLGPNFCVVMCTEEAVREAKDLEGVQGLAEINEDRWSELSRFSIQFLGSPGDGQSQMEVMIKAEADWLSDQLEHPKTTLERNSELVKLAVLNVVKRFVYGQRYSGLRDPSYLSLREYLDATAPLDRQLSVERFFPWTKKVLSCLPFNRYSDQEKYDVWLDNYNMNQLQEHEESLDRENIRDFLDFFLVEMKNNNKTLDMIKDSQFHEATMGFLRVGSLAATAWLQWALLAMALHPRSAQAKVKKELEGVGGLPNWEDRKRMPFTMASLMETLRWRTPVPVAALRRATQDTTIQGMEIPEGTVLIANLWSIHMDRVQWEDPNSFRPERMLTDDGSALLDSFNYLPFSSGHHDCPSQTMATMMAFLFFTNIMHRFKVSLPPGRENDLDGTLNFTLNPKKFFLKFDKKL